jgi:hypothetical protein
MRILIIIAVIAMIISIARISISIDSILICDCCDGGKNDSRPGDTGTGTEEDTNHNHSSWWGFCI